ncbi:uncharacterized protein LOC115016002 [Cottoperca gobio]|uniref:Uncharacterized protein LOC115016002 n=1 Tax=Cottoperca gobio TaxID=56716 RepID=A0A6J2QMA8_COTGO|nr:uncharacterized protein LOC115016002 [Cottoperca gobio]
MTDVAVITKKVLPSMEEDLLTSLAALEHFYVDDSDSDSDSDSVPLSSGQRSHRFPRRDQKYLRMVSDFVSSYRDMTVSLKTAGATWKIGGLDDTIYRDQHDEVKEWGELYLPHEVTMQVIGVVEGTSCPYDQLVLMTCEKQEIYAFDGEELHYVGPDMKWVRDLEYPQQKSYYKGEAFKHMSEDDWERVRKSSVGKRLDQEHDELVKSKQSKLLDKLKSTRCNTGVCS